MITVCIALNNLLPGPPDGTTSAGPKTYQEEEDNRIFQFDDKEHTDSYLRHKMEIVMLPIHKANIQVTKYLIFIRFKNFNFRDYWCSSLEK